MKKYFEKVIDSNGRFHNVEMEVREYSFEDWIEGNIKSEDWLSPLMTAKDFEEIGLAIEDRPINHLVENISSGWHYYDRVFLSELAKIFKEAQRLYCEKAEKAFVRLKSRFEEQYGNSIDKEYLLKREIDGYEKLLFEGKFEVITRTNISQPLKEWGLNYTDAGILNIRSYYNLIIRGKRDFTRTNSKKSTNCRDGLYITTEAAAMYHKWLELFSTEQSDKNILIEALPVPLPKTGLPMPEHKEIYINEDILEILAKELAPHFDDKKRLADILIGKEVDERIVFKGNAKEFVELFGFLKERNLIAEDKSSISTWIHKNFLSYEKTKQKSKQFKLSTVEDYIKGQHYSPPIRFSILASLIEAI